MSFETIRLRLWNAQQGNATLNELYRTLKPYLIAGHRFDVTVKAETRSNEANNLLHATIDDIAKQLEWCGKKRDPEIWKRLLVAAWCRTRGDAVEILPALDGHGVDIVPARTSKLTRAECSELQEFVFAWGSEQGVRFSVPEYAEAT